MISVCRRRSVSSKRWLKSSVKSVSSVREKTPQREKKLSIPFACIPTRSVKRLYIQPSRLSSKWEGGVSFNRVYNPQEIRRLHAAFENTPFLPQEGHVLDWRKACSRMKKGMFLNEEGHVLLWWQAKIIDKWVRRLGERGNERTLRLHRQPLHNRATET